MFVVTLAQPPASEDINTLPGLNTGNEQIQAAGPSNQASLDKSLAAATKQIKKRLRSNGFKGSINPVPEGEPAHVPLFQGKRKREWCQCLL